MKKIILISFILLGVSGCKQFDSLNPDEIIRQAGNPFKEYAVPDSKVAKEIEDGILETEAEKNGLDLTSTTAHLISLTKTGTLGKGEVRILGRLTDEKLEELKKKNLNENAIVNYSCYFEYSYKNGYFIWNSDYKLKNFLKDI